MRIDDSTDLTRALSTLAGHSKQDLWQACACLGLGQVVG